MRATQVPKKLEEELALLAFTADAVESGNPFHTTDVLDKEVDDVLEWLAPRTPAEARHHLLLFAAPRPASLHLGCQVNDYRERVRLHISTHSPALHVCSRCSGHFAD